MHDQAPDEEELEFWDIVQQEEEGPTCVVCPNTGDERSNDSAENDRQKKNCRHCGNRRCKFMEVNDDGVYGHACKFGDACKFCHSIDDKVCTNVRCLFF